MKTRSLAGLALALALGGCSTYEFVDQGGGYYTGETVTRYSGTTVLGASTYPYYGYSPGISYGLRYYTPYLSPYGHGGYYHRYPVIHRPPHAGPSHPHTGHNRPSPRPDPPAEHRPEQPHLDGAPWRNISRTRPDGDNRPQRPGSRPPRAGGQQHRSGTRATGPARSQPSTKEPQIRRAAQVPAPTMRPRVNAAPVRGSSAPARAVRTAPARSVRRSTSRP